MRWVCLAYLFKNHTIGRMVLHMGYLKPGAHLTGPRSLGSAYTLS
jgi:hypothetical protein